MALQASLGEHTARLEPRVGSVYLTLVDPQGVAIDASDVRVVLTASGAPEGHQEEQRLRLTKAGSGWSAEATTTGAAGYVAVVAVTVDGNQVSTRFHWGEVETVEPAAGHGHGDDDAHGEDDHTHGEVGHAH